MDIVKAFEAARAQKTKSCIMRKLGIMKFRYVMPTAEYGFLMQEQYGPIGLLSGVTAYYTLTPEDLDALTWEVAAGKELQYDPQSDPAAAAGQESETLESRIDGAMDGICGRICAIVDDDTAGIDPIRDLAAGLKDLAATKCLLKSGKEGEKHDSQ